MDENRRGSRRYYSTEGQENYGYYGEKNGRRRKPENRNTRAQYATDSRAQRARRNEKRARRRWGLAILLAFILMLVLVAFIAGYFVNKKISDSADGGKASVPAASREDTDSELQDPDDEDAVIAEEKDDPEDEIDHEKAVLSNQNDNNGYQRVINRTYPIPENYIAGTGELATVEGIQMESEAARAAQKLLQAIRAEGLSLSIVSGYRTDDYQRGLYQRQISKQGGNELKAGTISAVPMTSEHQAGLAMDVTHTGSLEQSFANTPQGRWMEEHCAEFGFILRYPRDKERMTGVIYEPWHFRYVGSPEAAQAIMSSGQSMEEFYGLMLDEEDIEPYLPYLN